MMSTIHHHHFYVCFIIWLFLLFNQCQWLRLGLGLGLEGDDFVIWVIPVSDLISLSIKPGTGLSSNVWSFCLPRSRPKAPQDLLEMSQKCWLTANSLRLAVVWLGDNVSCQVYVCLIPIPQWYLISMSLSTNLKKRHQLSIGVVLAHPWALPRDIITLPVIRISRPSGHASSIWKGPSFSKSQDNMAASKDIWRI